MSHYPVPNKILTCKRMIGEHTDLPTRFRRAVIRDTVTMKSLTLALLVLLSINCAASDVGRRFPSEKHTIVDRVTGQMITVLTSSQYSDYKPYPTHDTWTADGNWIVFRSNRAGDGSQLFVVNEQTGDIVQLTDYPGVQSPNLSRKEMKLFYIRQQQGASQEGSREVIELNLGDLLSDSMSDQVKNPDKYERKVASLPAEKRGGELAVDVDETYLYWGNILHIPETRVERPQNPTTNDPLEQSKFRDAMRVYFESAGQGTSEINKINIKTGKIDKVIEFAFRMGHLQANPWKAGEIFYCNETGGDAEQRIWSVNADGTGNRPIYEETPDEWVTHETMSAPDEMMFILSGNSLHLRKKATGIAVINLRNDEMQLLDQVKEVYWHCNGSPDGRWAVGDTEKGNIYIISRSTGERIELTAGHPMRPDHAHPIFSRDSKRVLIQSGLLTDGKNLHLMVVNVP